MRLVIPLLAVCLAATSLATGAHAADLEIETIQCSGVLDPGALSTPGYGSWTGAISCVLGHGGDTVRFASGTKSYSLNFYDPNVLGTAAPADPDDAVTGGGQYEFHVREARCGLTSETRTHCSFDGEGARVVG